MNIIAHLSTLHEQTHLCFQMSSVLVFSTRREYILLLHLTQNQLISELLAFLFVITMSRMLSSEYIPAAGIRRISNIYHVAPDVPIDRISNTRWRCTTLENAYKVIAAALLLEPMQFI